MDTADKIDKLKSKSDMFSQKFGRILIPAVMMCQSGADTVYRCLMMFIESVSTQICLSSALLGAFRI